MTKQVIDFNRLPKQEYMQPTTNVVRINSNAHLLINSVNTNVEGLRGGNTSGNQGNAWSRGGSDWDDDEEE